MSAFSEQASSESTPKSREDVASWLERIQNKQRVTATPEVLARMREQAQRQQRSNRTEKSVRSAKRLEKANYLSSASNMMHLQNWSASPAPPSAASYESRAQNMMESALTLQQCSRAACATEEEEYECAQGLDALSLSITNEIRQAESDAVRTPQSLQTIQRYDELDERSRQQTAHAMESEMDALLRQLAVEPTEESELTAKFALFETFLATIVKIRGETMEFWRENCDLFEGASRTAAQQDINKIDNEDAMGIQEDPSKWFVYLMTKKANSNCGMIGRTLASLRARLEMIQSDDGDLGECPFCLEDMTAMGQERTLVLGCCHRVCRECWDHWREVKQNRDVFCPLCKHVEFVADVLSTPIPPRR